MKMAENRQNGFPFESLEALFEVHLTGNFISDAAILKEIVAASGWKLLCVQLSRGATPLQPMITFRRRGTLKDVLAYSRQAVETLSPVGFDTTRVKVEVDACNSAVPSTDDQLEFEELYFEHHIKLLLSDNADIQQLGLIGEGHAAHLSKNTFRQRKDGNQERFITARHYRMGRSSSMMKLDQLLADLRILPHPILEVESEYCVYDSNQRLDDGWLITKSNKEMAIGNS